MKKNIKKFAPYLLLLVFAVFVLINYINRKDAEEESQTQVTTEIATSTEVTDTTEDAGTTEVTEETDSAIASIDYQFRNENLRQEHFEKHGIEMGFDSAESYEKAASDVINNPAALHKTEAEDGDYCYYVEATNEFVILSLDGYIRTYYYPNSGIDYYNRQ